MPHLLSDFENSEVEFNDSQLDVSFRNHADNDLSETSTAPDSTNSLDDSEAADSDNELQTTVIEKKTSTQRFDPKILTLQQPTQQNKKTVVLEGWLHSSSHPSRTIAEDITVKTNDVLPPPTNRLIHRLDQLPMSPKPQMASSTASIGVNLTTIDSLVAEQMSRPINDVIRELLSLKKLSKVPDGLLDAELLLERAEDAEREVLAWRNWYSTVHDGFVGLCKENDTTLERMEEYAAAYEDVSVKLLEENAKVDDQQARIVELEKALSKAEDEKKLQNESVVNLRDSMRTLSTALAIEIAKNEKLKLTISTQSVDRSRDRYQQNSQNVEVRNSIGVAASQLDELVTLIAKKTTKDTRTENKENQDRVREWSQSFAKTVQNAPSRTSLGYNHGIGQRRLSQPAQTLGSIIMKTNIRDLSVLRNSLCGLPTKK